MIDYDPGYWALNYIFVGGNWSGSVVPKTLVWALLFGLFSLGFCELFGPAYPNQPEGVRMRLRRDMALAWATYTGIMATLLVFRLNQGYVRYWECARSLYQMRSKWLNAVSAAFTFCTTQEGKQSEVKEFQRVLSRLVSWLCCASLHQLEEKRVTLEILDTRGMDESKLKFLDEAPDQVEVLMHWIQRLLVVSQQDGIMNVPPPILTRVWQELGAGVFEFNNIRKVHDIPIPYPYSQMVTMLLIFHVTFTAVASAIVIDNDLMAFLITFVSVMANVGVYYVSHELEHPFGSNMNDLPMVESLDWLNRGLSLLLDDQVQQPPRFSSGYSGTPMMFKVSHSFADCHRKSMINMDAYEAVVHDLEDAYELFGHKSEERRTSAGYMSQGNRDAQGCISFSPTNHQSQFMKYHGRSQDSDLELTSMGTRNIPKETSTDVHLEELQVAVDERAQEEALGGREPALTAAGSTAFADAATLDAGRVPLLRSAFEPQHQGLSHTAVAYAGHAERFVIATPVKAEPAHSTAAGPVDTGQASSAQASGPLREGPIHTSSANPSGQSSGECVQASSEEIQYVASLATEDGKSNFPAGLYT